MSSKTPGEWERDTLSHKSKSQAAGDMTRPYERCEQFGPEVLADEELLAVILRTGMQGKDVVDVSREILAQTKGLTELLSLSVPQMRQLTCVGRVRAIQLVCIAELARRLAREKAARDLVLDEPGKAADYYMEQLRRLPQEQLLVVFLNTRLRLVRESVVSLGTADTSVITPREILLEALRSRAAAFLMLHNHPGGDPEPSEEDILLTRRVREAADIVGIRLTDHLIIGDGRYVSLRERGLL